MRSHSSDVSPKPVSATSMIIFPSWRLVRKVSVPPFGIASIALSTRFDSARCNKSGSAAMVPRFSANSKLALDRSASRRVQLCLIELHDLLQDFIHHHSLQLWLRHLRKLTEAADDLLEVRNLR